MLKSSVTWSAICCALCKNLWESEPCAAQQAVTRYQIHKFPHHIQLQKEDGYFSLYFS